MVPANRCYTISIENILQNNCYLFMHYQKNGPRETISLCYVTIGYLRRCRDFGKSKV